MTRTPALCILAIISSSLFLTCARSGQLHLPLPSCWANLVESIPEGVIYPRGFRIHPSTYLGWNRLLDSARQNISIAAFYWSLLAQDVYNSSSAHQGEFIFRKLLKSSKDVNVSIVTNGRDRQDNELDQLKTAGAAVKFIDFEKFLRSGVQHAKLWSVDNTNGYIGSANMDWRSLTQVKELGVVFENCSTLVSDLAKILGALGYVSESSAILPIKWGPEFTTIYNRTNPLRLLLNGIPANVYITMSPPPFTPPGREDDLGALRHLIGEARSFIYVSVMDFQPIIKTYSNGRDKYWPVLTDALVRASLEQSVEVRILVSRWKQTSKDMPLYMKSLRALHGVHGAKLRIRFFVVPTVTPEQLKIPFARVNHNKYMVTDGALYIGTSNWSGDYFLFTGGAALVVEGEGDSRGTNGENSLRRQLEEVFLRDWNSEFADEL